MRDLYTTLCRGVCQARRSLDAAAGAAGRMPADERRIWQSCTLKNIMRIQQGRTGGVAEQARSFLKVLMCELCCPPLNAVDCKC